MKNLALRGVLLRTPRPRVVAAERSLIACRTRGSASFSTVAEEPNPADSSSSSTFADYRHHQQHKRDSTKMASIKEQLLACALNNVKEHGWTNDAIAAAASTTPGVSIAAAGLISVTDLIAYSMDMWNERLRRDLQNQRQQIWEEQEELEKSTTSTMTDRISWALQRRLSYVQDLVQAGRWHEGMAVGAHPENILRTREQLAELIDAVLTESCPEQHDSFSFAERLSLGGVYVATELHMIGDDSENYNETWTFLRRRVNDWEDLRRKTSGLLPLSLIPNVPNILAHHTPADILFTANAVGSALASGVMSLLNPPAGATTASSATTSTPHVYSGQGDYRGVINKVDGSHPSHYD